VNIKELKPSERGEIIWLSKSGYTPEAIARELHLPLPLPVVKAWLKEKGILK
jgi:hypothetical protein